MPVPYIDMIYYLLVCVYLSKPTTFAKQHTTKFHNQNKTYSDQEILLNHFCEKMNNYKIKMVHVCNDSQDNKLAIRIQGINCSKKV